MSKNNNPARAAAYRNATAEEIVVRKARRALRLDYSMGKAARLGGNPGFRDDSPSLDRREPSAGYVSGNVAVISWRANAIKKDASLRELESLVSYLRTFHVVEAAE